MQRPETSIEEALARLMPKAISEGGQRSLDEMLDELCGEEEQVPIRSSAERSSSGAWRILVPAGIAASVALIATFRPHASERMISQPAAVIAQDLVLVSESDRVEKMSDEGWVADPQGGMMQAVRMRVIEENSLRDEETGIVVHVSEPRDELLLIPVNEF